VDDTPLTIVFPTAGSPILALNPSNPDVNDVPDVLSEEWEDDPWEDDPWEDDPWLEEKEPPVLPELID